MNQIQLSFHVEGKSEFKGRSKRDTLAIRARAQARKSESPLQVIVKFC